MSSNTNNIYNQILNLSNESQFNPTPIDYSALQKGYQVLNSINQQAAQNRVNQTVQQSPYSEQTIQEAINNIRNYQNPVNAQKAAEMQKSMTEWSPFQFEGHPILTGLANLPTNVVHDLGEIGTGLVYMGTHLPEVGKQIGDYYTDLAYDPNTQTALSRAGRFGRDAYNLIWGDITGLSSQNLRKVAEAISSGDTQRIKDTAKEVGSEVWDRATKDPFMFASVVAPKTTSTVVGKAGKVALNTAEKVGLPVGQVSQKVAGAIETVEAAFGDKKSKLHQVSRKLSGASEGDLENVIAHRRKNEPLRKGLEKLDKDFLEFNKLYQELFPEETLVNPREFSALQYVADKTGKTYQEVRRTLKPQLDALEEGVTDSSLRFENRLDNFNHELNKLKKDGILKDLDTNKKVADLQGEEANLFNRHFDDAEQASFVSTDMTVKEAIQYLKDVQKDAWAGDAYIGKAAKNAKFQENMSRLAGLADRTGDPMLKYLHEGMTLADAGDIRPFTMAGAEIPEGATVSNEGRRFAGKASSREYGTATNTAVAKAYRDIHHFIDDTVRNKINEEIISNIRNNGTIDGTVKLVDETTKAKDIRYINPETLAKGSLVDAVNTVSNTAQEGYIPISKYHVNALKSMLKSSTSPFGRGALSDVYNTAKEAFLSSGTYLGGNAISGAFGTMLNSGSPQGLIKDVISAVASKGELAKKLGVYREVGIDNRKFNTALGKFAHTGNKIAGGWLFPHVDAWMQNKFAEINTHANLRKMGIKASDRTSALSNMDKLELAKVIDNVKYSSMMNSKYRIFPKGTIRDMLGIANPFLDWTDTATQVTAKMYLDHPYLMGMAAADLFGNIGLDKEMQNRLGLRVYSDKPLVTYKADSKSPNGAKEIRMSMLPQLTPLEFFSNPTRMIAGNGAPALTAIYEATKGKNAYGNLMRRTYEKGAYPTVIQQGKRYRQNPETGQIEEINKTQWDEVLAASLRNISGIPSLINKTVAPIGAEIYNRFTGENAQYHMPYGQSVFGSFQTGQPELGGGINRNILSTGDPSKVRTVGDVVKGLGTIYETDYYPEDQIYPRAVRSFRRSGARRARRDYSGE